MKKLILMVLVSIFGFSSFAGTFSCSLDTDKSVLVNGVITQSEVNIQISDKNEVLEIRELKSNELIKLYRNLRKQEDKYSFAKYYVDFNAWQDIEISVPKNISGKYFKAFLTVYDDNGDRMVPGIANKLSCALN